MLILGIETSCDETAVGIVKEGKYIVSNIVLSQDELHKKYYGVVPEIASRAHIQFLNKVISKALKEAKIDWTELAAVAVTTGPGLVGSLMIGVSVAKAISFYYNLPLISIDHINAHIYSIFLSNKNINLPFIGLVISGGHTLLTKVNSQLDYEIIGTTTDDAVGESFDKVAKLLELGYPGGPAIDKISSFGDPDKIKFPKGSATKKNYNFSYSGIKTAVLYYLKKNLDYKKEDVAASFQKSAIDILYEKTISLALKLGIKTIGICGGVAANSYLRKKFLSSRGFNVYFPELELCTDNGAMVAGLAYHKLLKKDFAPLNLEVYTHIL